MRSEPASASGLHDGNGRSPDLVQPGEDRGYRQARVRGQAVPPVGLVLSGGGARGAYQGGALAAIAEICDGRANPFHILVGSSAGSINASFWAGHADDIGQGGRLLRQLWSQVTAEQVFRTGALSMGGLGLRWMTDLSLGGLIGTAGPRALLDTTPLAALIEKLIPFGKIAQNIERGDLGAVAVTAVDYFTSSAITFVQGRPELPMWVRQRRRSERTDLKVEHVVGSSAIPLFFPPAQIGNRFFGDGCLRNSTPLSPALHLGAERLLVIGVRSQSGQDEFGENADFRPSVARVMNVLLNAVLLDGIEVDIERLERINRTVRSFPEEQRPRLPFRSVDIVWIHPTRDIGKMAQERSHHLPAILRYLMKGLGPVEDASEIVSYLLFEPEFCGELVELGYRDTMARRAEIEWLLGIGERARAAS